MRHERSATAAIAAHRGEGRGPRRPRTAATRRLNPLNPPAHAETPSASDAPEDRLDALVRSHQQPLWRYLRHLGCDAHTAADLAQEAFVTLMHRLDSVGPQQVFAFLRGTARNLWRNWARTNGLSNMTGAAWERAVDDLWADEAEPDERLARLRACLEQLGERARQGIRLFYEEELSRGEAATQLGMTENGIKSLLVRSRKALSACVGRGQGGQR